MDFNDPNKLMNGIGVKMRALTAKNMEYPELAEKAAACERDFDVGYAKKMLELKCAGESATLTPKLAIGDPAIADLKFKKTVAEAVYKACSLSMTELRTAIDAYRSMLTWLREEKRG